MMCSNVAVVLCNEDIDSTLVPRVYTLFRSYNTLSQLTMTKNRAHCSSVLFHCILR